MALKLNEVRNNMTESTNALQEKVESFPKHFHNVQIKYANIEKIIMTMKTIHESYKYS